MNKKHLLFMVYAVMSAFVLSVASCSSDDSDDSPSQKVEKAMVINMMKGSYENATKLGSLYINESNNFTIGKDYVDFRCGEIATVGKVNGLGGDFRLP